MAHTTSAKAAADKARGHDNDRWPDNAPEFTDLGNLTTISFFIFRKLRTPL
ncbi:MAG: hypothetical protein ACR2PO_06680 [Methyloligellaceae bacterium]